MTGSLSAGSGYLQATNTPCGPTPAGTTNFHRTNPEKARLRNCFDSSSSLDDCVENENAGEDCVATEHTPKGAALRYRTPRYEPDPCGLEGDTGVENDGDDGNDDVDIVMATQLDDGCGDESANLRTGAHYMWLEDYAILVAGICVSKESGLSKNEYVTTR